MKILHVALRGVIVILALFCLAFAAMQTKGFKKFVRERIIASTKGMGCIVTIGSIEGTLPFQWVLHDLHIEIDPRNTLDIKKANLRLAFFPLLRKEIAISYLSCQNTSLLYSEDTTAIPPLSFPWTFSLRSLRAEGIQVKKFETQKTGLFSCRGKGSLKKRMSGFLADIKLSSDVLPNSFVEIFLLLKNRHLETAALIQSKSAEAFEPFFSLPYKSEGILEGQLAGPWSTWCSLFSSQGDSALAPLIGTLQGKIDKIEIPHLKIANRKWNLSSLFQLKATREIALEKLDLTSNIFVLESKATFTPSFEIKEAKADFAFPKLALLSIYLPITLNGNLTGKLVINENLGFFEMNGEHFSIGTQEYSNFRSLFKAKNEEGIWSGRAELVADNPFVPIIAQSEFELSQEKVFSIKDFVITAPETKIAGHLLIDMPHQEIQGCCFGQILSLRPYRAWTARHCGLEGSAGGALSFFGKHIEGHFLVKNLHYFHTLSDDLSFDFALGDVFGSPYFECTLNGDNLYTPPFHLSRYDFYTGWDGKKGIYQLLAKGEWKELLEIRSKGYWTPYSLLINSLEGNLLKENFALEQPISITASEDSLTLSPSELRFGSGHLSTALHLNKTFSKGYLRATHFPLDLLLVAHSNLSIGGITNVEAEIEGNEDNLSGRLNLTLEKLDLYQANKTEPLQAKGTLEAKLYDRTLEFQSDIQATGEQFFRAKTTLPIDYNLYPFDVWLNHRRPISGELSFKGKMEEIFDFMNIGSHRISGMICSELSLNQTLENPSLKGYLDLHQGDYENYYTGTHLKNIEAHLEATGNKVLLTSFQANDEHEGMAQASGVLLVDLPNHFPYTANADLTNINLLKFDSVQGQLTGPLSIKGTSQSAAAEGSLTVIKADLAIPDTLPPDIPVIPVKYVNKPAHLDANTIYALPLFPFNLKLDLTAPGSIQLRGKGLRSEWQGNALLSGTNANITARGNLSLIKGEFVFSGKVFTLTQGEIVFTDQNTQHAYINLKGELTLPELTITAILNGPLAAPVLTFQSSPHLPTSSILSHILFNKDISDINAFQALQIAQTLLTLSGGAGPDVLEKIRKTIGVDRLNIISSSQNPDEMALQIGKYLTKGVMVTLAQGFNSSQIIVEVELKYGFSLQAETQEVEEGKFSLKWNRNY